MPFKPIVDKDLVDDPVLPDEPLNIIQSGNYNKVPLIMGTNQNEGLLIKGFYARNHANYDIAYDNWKSVGPLAFFHREKDEFTEEESKITDDYVKKYFGDTRFAHTGKGSDMLVQMYGDLLFTGPADAVSRMMCDQVPLYQYIYNHQGYFSLYDVLLSKPWQLVVKVLGMKCGLGWFKSDQGICHADELFMMFKGSILPDSAVSDQDKRVRATLIDMWVNFATNHNPTPAGQWTKFNNTKPQYLEIGSEENKMMYPSHHKDRMDYMNNIYKKVPCTMRWEKSKTWSFLDN